MPYKLLQDRPLVDSKSNARATLYTPTGYRRKPRPSPPPPRRELFVVAAAAAVGGGGFGTEPPARRMRCCRSSSLTGVGSGHMISAPTPSICVAYLNLSTCTVLLGDSPYRSRMYFSSAAPFSGTIGGPSGTVSRRVTRCRLTSSSTRRRCL